MFTYVFTLNCSHHAWVSSIGFTEFYNEAVRHLNATYLGKKSKLDTQKQEQLRESQNYRKLMNQKKN